jgi:hypothetical protein
MTRVAYLAIPATIREPWETRLRAHGMDAVRVYLRTGDSEPWLAQRASLRLQVVTRMRELSTPISIATAEALADAERVLVIDVRDADADTGYVRDRVQRRAVDDTEQLYAPPGPAPSPEAVESYACLLMGRAVVALLRPLHRGREGLHREMLQDVADTVGVPYGSVARGWRMRAALWLSTRDKTDIQARAEAAWARLPCRCTRLDLPTAIMAHVGMVHVSPALRVTRQWPGALEDATLRAAAERYPEVLARWGWRRKST